MTKHFKKIDLQDVFDITVNATDGTLEQSPSRSRSHGICYFLGASWFVLVISNSNFGSKAVCHAHGSLGGSQHACAREYIEIYSRTLLDGPAVVLS